MPSDLHVGIDMEVAKKTQQILKKQGLNFKLNTKVTGATPKGDGYELALEDAKKGKTSSLDAGMSFLCAINH